MIFFHMYYNS